MLVLGLFAALAATAANSDTPPRPNIILITVDDLGLQLGSYGDTTITTPNIDCLGTEGVRFSNAHTTSPSCSSARSSIFTGTYPTQNGQIGLAHHGFTMTQVLPTIPKVLASAGYCTGVIGKVHVNPGRAFTWHYNAPFRTWPTGTRDVGLVADTAQSFIAGGPEPFFLKISYLDPHDPLIDQVGGEPPTLLTAADITTNSWTGRPVDEAQKPRIASYYNAVRRVDAGVGKLQKVLEDTGVADRTVVILMSDHGGGPVQQGKLELFENGTRIALFVRAPGIAVPGQVRDELVSQVDVLPTVLALAQVPVPVKTAALMTEGRSMLPLLEGGAAPDWRRHLFSEMNYHSSTDYRPARSVRDEKFKLVQTYAPRLRGPDGLSLYAVVDGRQAGANLADSPDHAEVRTRLLGELQAWQERIGDPLRIPPSPTP